MTDLKNLSVTDVINDPLKDLSQQTDLSVLNVLDDLVSIVDTNYHYIAVSVGYQQFFGLTENEIINKSVAHLHGADTFTNHLKPFLDKALTGEEVSFQFWTKNSQGEARFIDSKHALYIVNNKKAVAVVARDITEQMYAKIMLEKEKRVLSTMIDAIPGFIFIKDNHGVYQQCNKAFEQFVGKHHDEIVGQNDDTLMSKKSAAYIKENDRQVFLGNRVQCDEWVTYNHGERRLLDMLKIPLIGENGLVEGLIGIGSDVTEQREAEKQLQLAALVFETTSEPCFIFDNQGNIQTANVAAKQQFFSSEHHHQLVNINDVIFLENPEHQFLPDVVKKNRQWKGEVRTTDGISYLATLNSTANSDNIPDHFVLILRDNSQNKALEHDLSNKAYYDFLTGLPNRLKLLNSLHSSIIRCERQKRQLAVIFIDLDKFKPINDQFGHFEGDKVLIELSNRLSTEMRKTDLLARLGGDEFVAIIDIVDFEQAKHVAEKLLLAIEQAVNIQQHDLYLSASIGMSVYPTDGNDAQGLLDCADQAMYEAKSAENNILFYNQLMNK